MPLGPPTLISQANVSITSHTSLPQPYVQTPDVIPGFGGPRALFSYPSATSYESSRAPTQVMGPSSHGQAQQSASINQSTAQSSIMKQTLEQPKIAREQAEKLYGQGLHAEGIIDASKVPSRYDTVIVAPSGLPSQISTSDASEKLAPTSDWKHEASVPGSSSPVENVDQVQPIADKTSQMVDSAETDDSSITVTKTSPATLVEKDKISAEISGDSETAKNINEAVDVFKSLLESANVGSDWTWEQAMREIINERRYGALRTLGERKQAFNEFLGELKRAAEEERVARQRKRYEDFKRMLELTPTTRWSKAVTIDLKEKEGVKALEDRKRNISEYRRFLESCDFIKPNSQWCKVQDLLEVDERCSRLEKIDQLGIFQVYLRNLEREEEDRKKIQKEELKKAERKHRDDFRGLIDEHIATGELTAKTSWRDYLMKVRDIPVYSAIASNSSGATPKELFEDDVEDLKRKVALSAGSTFDEFKVSISEAIGSPPIPDVKLKLVFDDLLERAKEKEEKEARKQTRHSEKLMDMLRSFKDITASSTWEELKHLVEGSEKCRTIGDESFRKQTFEDYVSHLKEQSKRIKHNKKVPEEHDKGKDKYRREKDRVRERDSEDRHKKGATDNYNHDMNESHGKERRRTGRDSGNRHRVRHTSLKEDEIDHLKEPHKAGGGHKKSRQQRGLVPEAGKSGVEERKRVSKEKKRSLKMGNMVD
ncbi:hypothetical protein AALP_AA3G226000 [Arabis alpina]|uniref:FF domain-containing protein n=1 Tax=Arabis alpina TaxID=50452 RepID=A0A087HAZ2_ARAAL|nr:hypothetical protein AALP_AA3G226000 [Arabis alpina]